ncbi:hypothetical protein EHS25_006224 [Saitozyma podzolica]|uniref:Uncharacterized protein n=1 Tax=Saitozyma podzolica TaxID=1890683 RepID=A0A427XRR9_9TREE|nr:hypothetical protein EHS25_006224 [Saitozyma podzolica]
MPPANTSPASLSPRPSRHPSNLFLRNPQSNDEDTTPSSTRLFIGRERGSPFVFEAVEGRPLRLAHRHWLRTGVVDEEQYEKDVATDSTGSDPPIRGKVIIDLTISDDEVQLVGFNTGKRHHRERSAGKPNRPPTPDSPTPSLQRLKSEAHPSKFSLIYLDSDFLRCYGTIIVRSRRLWLSDNPTGKILRPSHASHILATARLFPNGPLTCVCYTMITAPPYAVPTTQPAPALPHRTRYTQAAPPHSTSIPCPRLSRLASTPAAGSFAVARELPAWSLIVAHGFCL